MKAILIMMDTCCRHMLRLYRPEAKASTPNIDRLAERSLVFVTFYCLGALYAGQAGYPHWQSELPGEEMGTGGAL